MKKVLIIRFSSIGDLVLTSPVVRCLKEQLGVEVHFLTKKNYAGIVANNPHVDKVHEFKGSIKSILPDLKKENFDAIIDLHHNLRTLMVKKSLGVKAYAFNKLNFKKYLLVRFKVNRMPKIHIVDRYLKAVAPLGVKNDGRGLDYFIPKKDELNLDESLPQGFSSYVALVIGGQHATKMLPKEKLLEIILGLKKPVVILGGPEDRERGEWLLEQRSGQFVFNACGKFNLNQSAYLVKMAEQVITHDTGLMHIAAAFQKNIFSLWGNTVPDLGMYPYLPGEKSQVFEVENLSCRPCSKIGFKECPKGHFDCMEKQNLPELIDKVNEA